jgi:hypothetical protein
MHVTPSALHTKGILRFAALSGCLSATTVQCASPSFAKSDHERIAAADALVRLRLVVVRRHDLGNDPLHRNRLLDERIGPRFAPCMGVVESSNRKKGPRQRRGPLVECLVGNPAGYAEAFMIIIMIRFRLGRWKVFFSIRT